MAALTKDRNTRRKEQGRTLNAPVASGAVIYAGALVSSNASGFAVPASDTAGEEVLGRADHAQTGGAGDGDTRVRVSKGVFAYATEGANAMDQADLGRTVYVLDDQTLVKAAGTSNSIAAGVLDEIDPETGRFFVKITDGA